MKKTLLFFAVWLIYSFGMTLTGFSQNANVIYEDGPVKIEQLPGSWKVLCWGKTVAHGDGFLNINDLPPAFQDFLNHCAQLNESEAKDSPLRGQAVTDQYGPLITTQWNQHSPYNNDCPTSKGEKVVTGCSTISTGQILNYFRYCNPINVSGSSQSTKTNDLQAPYLSNITPVDTATVTFNYEYSYTPIFNQIDKSQEELAKFIVAIALAQKADFGTKATSTVTNNQFAALQSIFGYQGTKISIGSLTEKDYIANHIKQGFPVLISGSNDDGSHSFIIDGYNGTEFHVNYGWGGSSDGWFSTTEYPKNQRIQRVYPSTPNVTGMQADPAYLYIVGENGVSKKIAMKQAGDNSLEYKQEEEVSLPAGAYRFWFEYADKSTISPYSDTTIVLNETYLKKGHFTQSGTYFTLEESHDLNFWHLQNKGEIKVEVVDRRIDVVAHVTDAENNPIKGAYVTTSNVYPLETETYKNEGTSTHGYRLRDPFIWATEPFIPTKSCLNKVEFRLWKVDTDTTIAPDYFTVGILDEHHNVVWSKPISKSQITKFTEWHSISINGTIGEGSDATEVDGNLLVDAGKTYYVGLMVDKYNDKEGYFCYSFSQDDKRMLFRVHASDYFVKTDANGTCTLKMDKEVAKNLYAHYTNYTFLPEKIDHPETNPHHIYFKGVKTSTLNNIENEHTLESISILTLPDKKEYLKGESLNLDGLTVAAVYDNGVKVQIADYTIKEETQGENEENIRSVITVTYKGKATQFQTYWHSHSIHYIVDDKPYQTKGKVIVGSTITHIEDPLWEGYTFNGWTCEYETMPDKDIFAFGYHILNSYKVTFSIDGVLQEKSYEIKYGYEIPFLTAPTKEGYTFSGWVCEYETMPAHNIEITGSFIPNKHTITYMINGETYKTVEDVAFGSTITFIENPEGEEGYSFSGWECEYTTMPDKDIIINGSYNINRHNITFLVDGERYDSILNVPFDSTIPLLEIPKKTGHTFSGWKCEYETMPDADIEIKGTFTPTQYTITYKVDGTKYKTAKVAYGSAITLIDNPAEKEGYTFSGWKCSYKKMPAKNITVTGNHIVNRHTITFKVDGEPYGSIADVPFDSLIPLMEEPTKIGHTFSGWENSYTQMPDMDIEISGSFTPNTYNITYKVDGTDYQTIENVAYGTTITLIEAPAEKEGFFFSGWNCQYKNMPDSNIEITGFFFVNRHNINFMVDGELFGSIADVPFDSIVPFLPEPTKAGYTFSGWNCQYKNMPDEDIEITGFLSVNRHNINFMVDGALYGNIADVPFDSIVPFLPEPTKTGYTFSG
ncbi:MAG: InlB B-repeat-containing protein, partial [Paludibacteraceae bacterium]|nr:InlB B-repeat-containing protein [Paludibacteraceae bacterium]